MCRGLILATVVLMIPGLQAVQAQGVLRIKVVVADSTGKAVPVPQHRLQISDNPATAAPRRIVTSLEGTVDVRLAPGNYTIESERPVVIQGKTYQWTVVMDIVAGRDAVLELTDANADGVPAAGSAAPPVESDRSSLLALWQDSIMAIWTATARGSGFLIDANGLIATDRHVIGDSMSVEVQLSPTLKVAGTVIASDHARGIALVRIHPSIVSSIAPLPLECDGKPEFLTVGQQLTGLEAPVSRLRGTPSGRVDSVLPNAIDTDLDASNGGSGGPVFAPSGRLIGLTTLVPELALASADDRTRIMPVARLCELVASEAAKVRNSPPPSPAHLPVESLRPFPVSPGGARVTLSAGSTAAYRAETSDFDITFITPPMLMAAEARSDRTGGDFVMRLLADFGNWSHYVDTLPPVLFVRVTPKLPEGLLSAVLSAIKGLKPFATLRAFCGDAEIVPVHPLKLAHRLPGNDTLVEGLYAFDPGALAPTCATVRLQVYSEKETGKADTVIVEPKVIQKVWQDFAPHRAVK
jgi:hypothetical protein